MPTSGFHTTSWTLVRTAAGNPTVDSREALAALCEKYWHPVYAFVRRRGYDPDESLDLTQTFFARLIEKNYLADADPDRGRFRSFLLTAVKHFLANEWDRANALKRGGGERPASLEQAEEEKFQMAAVEQATPESLYQRRWALLVLENVMLKLRGEFVKGGKTADFDRLSEFLEKDSDSVSYETLAKELGVSAGSLRMSVHRLRQKYRRLLRAEIAESVFGQEEIDEELRFLLSILSA